MQDAGMRVGPLIPGLLLALLRALPAETAASGFVAAEPKGVLRSAAIKEASGLAVSSHDGGFHWVVNDSGAKPDLHLIEADGRYRGKVSVAKAGNVDWEDLVSFSMEGTPFLLAADTGDNDSKRETCTLYVLREPELPAAGKTLAGATHIAWEIRFRYEGGPRDCEAVAVDVPGRKILLLTKRTHPPEIHELPLQPTEGNRVLTTRRIGQTTVSAPADSLVPFRDQPTGLDIAPDNTLAAVVTYYGVFLFPRKPGESWPQAFARKPEILEPHCLPQAESVAFSKDGNAIIVASEGRGWPIVRYRRRPRRSQD